MRVSSFIFPVVSINLFILSTFVARSHPHPKVTLFIVFMTGFIYVSILYLYWFLYLYLSLYVYLRLYSSSPSDQLASVPGEWRLVHICYKLSICRCCFSSAPGHFGRRIAIPGHILISQRGPTTDAHPTLPFWAISISASH